MTIMLEASISKGMKHNKTQHNICFLHPGANVIIAFHCVRISTDKILSNNGLKKDSEIICQIKYFNNFALSINITIESLLIYCFYRYLSSTKLIKLYQSDVIYIQKSTMNKYNVFISYRRSDSSDRASLIHSYLLKWFNEENIFLDTHEIHEGPFPEYIEEALNSANFFILLISKNSINVIPTSPDKIDYYYEEIRRAIVKRLTIIPIVYDNIDFDNMVLPEGLESIKLQNAIYSHIDDPNGLKNRLYEFTKKKQKNLQDWITFPLAIITAYLFVSLTFGIGMYLHDRFFISYEDAVEIASEYIVKNKDSYFYPIAENSFISYNPQTKEIVKNSFGNAPTASIMFSEEAIYKIGFWTTATTLFYQIVKSKYKPHNGKQYLAYFGVAVAFVAGAGLGCTIERMIFPSFRVKQIDDSIYNPIFWQDVIKCKYKKYNRQIFVG